MADPTLLEQILFNLVSNAIKYSPKGGTVAIDISRDDAGQVCVAVTDRGPGIPQEFHERIFEKFYRVKDDHVYKVKGHGLGLYLSRFFADRMNALILVKSAPGQGSTFTLQMPESARREDQA
jgi:signal transduction histidine kinase